ncbi:nicotinate-nucleotide--dimethylbenzimidazole phosphoribosyltransferase [Pseudofrankia asymbiotica]|uniref:Nicotinate-nucleotide--dimethylbenzimidazole phosphoribosyltransferase n=1 Tax=Pseudofrankia asymbiotica TaxID=1834516 RepID=A0A1V2I894_9ACTN|nr:nicotinate-nucleotide--dimethylbenzimidazole phosphoribosyltransferase [Pseudofrankia asymbiotica]
MGEVPEPDAAAAAVEQAAAHRRALALNLPRGSLGKLSEVAAWLAAVQGVSPPRPIARPRAIVLAADHGIADAGLYPWPPGATARRLAAVIAGASPLAVLARRAGVGLRLVDIAVGTTVDGAPVGDDAGTGPSDEEDRRIRTGNGRIDQDDALTVAEAERAFVTGRRLADEEIDAGADLLIPGALGVGADTAAAVVVAALRDHEPIDVVDRGDGADDARWMLRTAAIRDALRRTRPFAPDARSVLRVAGGADLAAIAGVLVQAAIRRTPVIIDGPAACAAALAAERLAPGSRAWWLVGSDCPDPAARHAVEALGLSPLVDLKIRVDDATGAFAAAVLVTAAVETAADLDAAAAEAGGAEADVDAADIT